MWAEEFKILHIESDVVSPVLFTVYRPIASRPLYLSRSAPMSLSGVRAPMASRALIHGSNDAYRGFKMPVSMVSCTSTSTPRKVRKFTNRKNYLRQKLLKTLTKPYSNSLVSELPHKGLVIFQNEYSPDENYSFSSEQYEAVGGEEVEELELQETRVSEASTCVEIMDSSVSGFSKGSVLKFGFWLLGAFVFQTICAVWVLGSVDIIDKNGNDSNEKDKKGILDVHLNGKHKSKLKLFETDNKGFEGDGVFYLDEEDMEKKIEEIQLMARDVRERERLGKEKNGFQSDDTDEEDEELDFGKRGIEKEVNDRLLKLRRRLGYQEKLSVTFTNNVKKDGGERDELEKDDLNKEVNEGLMFKKKYKFRGSLSGKNDKPKGFKNPDHLTVPKEAMKDSGEGNPVLMNGNIRGGGLEKDGEKKHHVQPSKSLRTAGKKLVGRKKRILGQKLELVQLESELTGLTQDRREERSKTMKSSKSNVLETPAISVKQNPLNRKDNSKGTGNVLSTEIEHKKSESGTDLWWSSLPYVLVIFMRRGFDDGGPQGPFTLRCSSGSNSDFSHTVAFEDRGDATNFCYILQTFFEDLEDFSAEIVPLSIKELRAAVESEIIKVMVVKKGQLKLYAGQPLPEVEMALRSILGQG